MKTEARPARGGEKKRLHEDRIREVKRGRRSACDRRGRRGKKRCQGEEKKKEMAIQAMEDDHGGNTRTSGGSFCQTDPTTRRSRMTDDGETTIKQCRGKG